jgi:hypothetical protein
VRSTPARLLVLTLATVGCLWAFTVAGASAAPGDVQAIRDGMMVTVNMPDGGDMPPNLRVEFYATASKSEPAQAVAIYYVDPMELPISFSLPFLPTMRWWSCAVMSDETGYLNEGPLSENPLYESPMVSLSPATRQDLAAEIAAATKGNTPESVLTRDDLDYYAFAALAVTVCMGVLVGMKLGGQ